MAIDFLDHDRKSLIITSSIFDGFSSSNRRIVAFPFGELLSIRSANCGDSVRRIVEYPFGELWRFRSANCGDSVRRIVAILYSIVIIWH